MSHGISYKIKESKNKPKEGLVLVQVQYFVKSKDTY